jgi:hypothetical protein
MLNTTIRKFHLLPFIERPSLWSSGQSSWLQIRRPGYESRHYHEKESCGSGTGSTQPRELNEELLDEK